jgi:hypothetical protein
MLDNMQKAEELEEAIKEKEKLLTRERVVRG